MIYHFEFICILTIKESPSFEDKFIQKTHSTLDHTVENASCFVQSLSNYNSLNHALSLYVDVHSDQLSNSTINNDYVAHNQFKQVDQFDSTQIQVKKQINQFDEIVTSNGNTNGYSNNKEIRETKEISKTASSSAFESVQLKRVQFKELNGDAKAINGRRTSDDLSNKENEENYEDEETYTKIPVKDLISTFEKQTRPVIRYKLREDKLPEPGRMTVGFNADEPKFPETVSPCDENKNSFKQNEQLEQSNCSYSQNSIEFHDENGSSKNENYMNGNYENEHDIDNVDNQTQQGKRFSVFCLLILFAVLRIAYRFPLILAFILCLASCCFYL